MVHFHTAKVSFFLIEQAASVCVICAELFSFVRCIFFYQLSFDFLGNFSFMGYRIMNEVIKELLPQGLLEATDLIMAGSR